MLPATPRDAWSPTRGVQARTNDDNTSDLRFIATIDTLQAKEVGFVFSKSNAAPTRGSGTEVVTTTVYKSITAADETVTAESYNAKYIIACTVTGIPEGDIEDPLYVRAFYTVGDITKYTSPASIDLEELL